MTRGVRLVATVDGMSAARLVDAAIVAVAVTVAGVAVAVDDRAGLLEMLFGAVVLAAALHAARLVLTGYWRAARERGTARRLAHTAPGQVAAHAVVEERVRLAADIEAVVRAAVTRMRALADQALRDWDQDPVPSLHRVQEEGRHATDELRRLLGLLRQANPIPPTKPDPPSRSGARVRPLDVGIAAAIAVFAVAERYLYGESFVPGMSTPASPLLTAAAAATIVLRRTAPGAGAAACGLIFLGAALIQRPVSGGFWVLATVGGLAWAVAGRRTWSEAAGLAVLLAGVAAGEARGDPDNLSITVLVVVVGAGGGALWAWS